MGGSTSLDGFKLDYTWVKFAPCPLLNESGTKVICGKAVCNLVSCSDSQLAAVEAGAVPCLRQLAKLGVPEIEVNKPLPVHVRATAMQCLVLAEFEGSSTCESRTVCPFNKEFVCHVVSCFSEAWRPLIVVSL